METKKERKQAISLIVLIITIIVMIVLAGTIVMTLNNSGIIDRASEAVDKTNEAQIMELAQLSWAEAYTNGAKTDAEFQAEVDEIFAKNKIDVSDYGIVATKSGVKVAKGWVQDGVIVRRGNVTLKVGTVVNFDSEVAGYQAKISSDAKYSWRVLGAENGYLLLVSGNGVGLAQDGAGAYTGEFKSSTGERLEISSMKDGKTFIEQMEELDKICAIYGKGEQAVSARSIKVEDINRITGYNPNKTGTGYPYGVEGGDDDKPISDYGMTATYKFTEDNIVQYTYTYKGKTITDTWNDDEQYNTFCKIGETTNAPELYTDAGLTVKCDLYKYYIETLTTEPTDPKIGITDADVYNTISSNIGYWLNNVQTRTRQGGIAYNAMCLSRSNGMPIVRSYTLWNTTTTSNTTSSKYEVRAVVSVDPELTVDASGNLVARQ